MATPVVYVLIINWNGIAHLEACFDSLLASTCPQCRFCLVDNASDDDSVQFVKDHYGQDPRVEILVCPENLGWSGGNNAGIHHALAAGADYIVLLNNDTAIAPDALEKLLTMAEADPRCGALAPKMVLFHHPEILNSVGLTCSIIGSCWDIGIGRQDCPRWNGREEVIGVCGGAMFLRSAALRKAGLLPEDFEIYMDDLDLCLRIWECGYTIQTCPEAVVRHKFSATYGTGERARYKYFLNTRNRFWLLLRNFPASLLLLAAPWILLGECRALGRALLDGETWRMGAHLKAWGATLLRLPRLLGARWKQNRCRSHRGAYAHLIRKRPLFCPLVSLPDGDGWYPQAKIGDLICQPMGLRAIHLPESDEITVRHGNPHPALGTACVRLEQDGQVLATLSQPGDYALPLKVARTPVRLEAGHLFLAEDTGAPADYGGWIAIESAPSLSVIPRSAPEEP